MSETSENTPFEKLITQLVYEKYNSLKAGGKPQSHEWTVLSSIIEERDGKYSVIVLTTGTKCLGEQFLSSEGLLVNDCHAEVLSRRCFISYLLDQIAQFQQGKEEASIFKRSNISEYIYQLKDGVRFHLYISQSPCGYASEYHEAGSKRKAIEIANAKVRASKRLRSADDLDHGYENGNENEGVDNGCFDGQKEEEFFHRTGAKYDLSACALHLSRKPGRGDPSRSYSCSDKLCMYNHLGYQGGLLSTVIPPIYMTSITISGNWDANRMEEALIHRVCHPTEDESFVPPTLYHAHENSPLSESEVMLKLDGKRLASSGSSLLWIAPNQTESLIAGKGVRLGTNIKRGITRKNASRVCPALLFSSYRSLFPSQEGAAKSISYWNAKQLATAYQERKISLFSEWKRKDRHFLEFEEQNQP